MLVFALLLIDNSETKVDFIALLEFWVHFQNRSEGFFSMLKGTVSVIENANSIPQVGVLQSYWETDRKKKKERDRRKRKYVSEKTKPRKKKKCRRKQRMQKMGKNRPRKKQREAC